MFRVSRFRMDAVIYEHHIPAAEDISLSTSENPAREVAVVQRRRLAAERPAVVNVSLPAMP
jgi:hypothetical protein